MPAGQVNAAKTHCPQGHEYTPENTYTNPEGRRWCRACAKVNAKIQNLKKYQLTPESYEELLASQNYRCAICRNEFRDSRDTNIDHDHFCCDYDGSCGVCVRGVLCGECNRGLARFKESVANLQAAARYMLDNTPDKRAMRHGHGSPTPPKWKGPRARTN